jgi:eukaryotic-like serine/threonine-protein kinase
MAKRRIGPFEIEKQLGVGGMGIVYLATFLKTGQKVALKVLSPTMSANEMGRSRFEREMEILQKLRHKHIVRYFWGGTIKGQHLYAMEIMDGGSLEDWLKRKGRLSWEQTIDCARHVCKGLEHAHNAGVVHRDLKPANLFLSKKGYLKLGDFGIARDNQASALTAAGSTVGTYAYMAPEQITGASPITRKTDLYALGCVMYELLTGRTPFQADTMVEMLQKHLKSEPDRITTEAIDCPVWLEAVVMKLLEKDPDKRYYDALAVQLALDDVMEKVTKQQSVAKQTLEGGPNATVTSPELKKALGKKKKKKANTGPFYEQVWFLLGSLLLLIAFVTWAVWPLSEEQLYARAKVLMESQDFNDWRKAREEFIDPLQSRFPEGKYHLEAAEWIDKIEMDIAKRQIENRRERGLDPKGEAEKRYVQALDYQEFGDLGMAENELHMVMESLKSRPEDRPLYLLAQHQHHAVQTLRREQGWAVRSEDYVTQKIYEAEALFLKDKLKADKIWRDISQLYQGNANYAAQVQRATDRLANRPVDPLPAREPSS